MNTSRKKNYINIDFNLDHSHKIAGQRSKNSFYGKDSLSLKLLYRYLVVLLTMSFCLFFVQRSARAAAGFDSLSFKPANDHGYYLNVEQSQTLGRGGLAIGATGEFSDDSVVIKNAAGVRIQDLIQRQASAYIGAAFGIFDWLNVGAGVSGVPYQQYLDPVTLINDNGARMGDVNVNLKARLLDNKKLPIGVALVPFVTIPTGNEQHLIGNGKFTGGGLLVVDTKRMFDRVSLSLNAGGQVRQDVALTAGTTIEDQFLYGAGVNVAVAKTVQLIAEVDGWTTFNNFYDENNRNLEVNGALRLTPGEKQRFAITAGGGTGLHDGAGAPDWRVFTTVSYRNPREEEELPPPAEPLKEEVITTNKIHFAFNKSTIRPASYSIIENILAEIQGRPEVQSIRIEGHTDSVGSDEYNQKLSEERANAVRMFMVNKGYADAQGTAVGMGEGSPISDNTTKAGRAQNRRVEFHLQIRPGANVKVQKRDGSSSPTYEDGDPGERIRKNSRNL